MLPSLGTKYPRALTQCSPAAPERGNPSLQMRKRRSRRLPTVTYLVVRALRESSVAGGGGTGIFHVVPDTWGHDAHWTRDFMIEERK